MIKQMITPVLQRELEAFVLKHEHAGMITLAYVLAAQYHEQIREANGGVFPILYFLEREAETTTLAGNRSGTLRSDIIFEDYIPDDQQKITQLLNNVDGFASKTNDGGHIKIRTTLIIHSNTLPNVPLINRSILLQDSGISRGDIESLDKAIKEGMHRDASNANLGQEFAKLFPKFTDYKAYFEQLLKREISRIERCWFTVIGAYEAIYDKTGPLPFDTVDLFKGVQKLIEGQREYSDNMKGGHQ